ncbi:hypothetical protein BKA62DRAFT_706520 [Auriculariales sp. MPI-PUGE-AT-0066]|nr:hypothetical protein BKA62DRAFT_706520 [Auriculariales sp. MPI-PUGE-AT-0066]
MTPQIKPERTSSVSKPSESSTPHSKGRKRSRDEAFIELTQVSTEPVSSLLKSLKSPSFVTTAAHVTDQLASSQSKADQNNSQETLICEPRLSKILVGVTDDHACPEPNTSTLLPQVELARDWVKLSQDANLSEDPDLMTQSAGLSQKPVNRDVAMDVDDLAASLSTNEHSGDQLVAQSSSFDLDQQQEADKAPASVPSPLPDNVMRLSPRPVVDEPAQYAIPQPTSPELPTLCVVSRQDHDPVENVLHRDTAQPEARCLSDNNVQQVATAARHETNAPSNPQLLHQSDHDLSGRSAKRRRMKTPTLGVQSSPLSSDEPIQPPTDHALLPDSFIDSNSGVSQPPSQPLGTVADPVCEVPAEMVAATATPKPPPRIWKEYPSPPASTSPSESRPLLPSNMRPHAWCTTRQELCETFPRFRSYQSGVYCRDSIAVGYLLGGFPSPRDGWFLDGRLIISHGGGGSGRVESGTGTGKAKMELKQDQSGEARSPAALLHAYQNRVPVVLIMDKHYRLFPYECSKGMVYCVLGFYLIQRVWYEAERGETGQYHKRMKVAFGYMQSQGDPWWVQGLAHSMTTPQESAESLISSSAPLVASPDGECSRHVPTSSCGPLQPNSSTPICTISTTSNSLDLLTTPFLFPPMPRSVASGPILAAVPDVSTHSNSCATCHTTSPTIYELGWMCLNATCQQYWTLQTEQGPVSPWGEGMSYHLPFLAVEQAPAHTVQPTAYDFGLGEISAAGADSMHGFWCERCGRMGCRSGWAHYSCPTDGCETHLNLSPRITIDPFESLPINNSFWADASIVIQNEVVRVPISRTALVEAVVNKFHLPFQRGTIAVIRGNPAINATADDLVHAVNKGLSVQGARCALRRHAMERVIDTVMLTQYFQQNFGVPYKYVAGTDTTVPFDQAPESINRTLDLIRTRSSLLFPDPKFNEMLVAAYLHGGEMNVNSDFEEGLGVDVAALSLGASAKMTFAALGAPKGRTMKVLYFMLYHGDMVIMHGPGIQKCYEHKVEPNGIRIAATAREIKRSSGSVLSQKPDVTARKKNKTAPASSGPSAS